MKMCALTAVRVKSIFFANVYKPLGLRLSYFLSQGVSKKVASIMG
jgi:hypothetical protein